MDYRFIQSYDFLESSDQKNCTFFESIFDRLQSRGLADKNRYILQIQSAIDLLDLLENSTTRHKVIRTQGALNHNRHIVATMY